MQENQEDYTPESSPLCPTPVPETPGNRAKLWSAFAWIRDLAFSVLIAVVLIVFIYQPVKVEGTSMMPGLTDQERIFINKFTYRFGLGSIERGDTVVFEWPLDPSKSYIKRVIGLPGDRVRIDRGQVYVNDRPLVEDYVPSRNTATISCMQRDGGEAERIFRPGRPPEFLQRQPVWGRVPRGTSTAKRCSATGR